MKLLLILLATFVVAHSRVAAATSISVPETAALERAPNIVSVRGRTVKVQVPAGFRAITLQHRTARKGRPWAALETFVADGASCEVTFKTRKLFPRRLLRIVAQQETTLPASFLTGQTNFFGSAAGANTLSLSGGAVAGDGKTLSLASGVRVETDAVSRTVTESDIWKLSGDRLYFFNQYRGLQVLDVSNPDAPALLGQLGMPAQGDQLYELPGGYVALLTRRWAFDGENGEVVICEVSSGQPTEVARVPYRGSLRESRLVGRALYIAADQQVPGAANSWRQQTVVSGFDLSDPLHPVARPEVPVVAASNSSWGYAAAVWADENHFLVSHINYLNDGSRSTVFIMDISRPDGVVQRLGDVTVDGTVGDKFKLHVTGRTLSLISDVQRWGERDGEWFSNRKTVLTNFDISDPARPRKVGSMAMGEGETTYATRFDGDRVYIVTAIQADPLWLIDNADAARPKLTAHLEVPGFSTYIEPLGDRLVTVGRITGQTASGSWQNRTTVALYDVADAANPRLLSQLPIGEDWSQSEANWDEKAFTVLPEDHLIMLPFSQGWSWWGGASSGAIQLVDLQRNTLALRGVIAHGFTPRRSTVHKETVLALSSRDLLTVDIADRDHPVVKADLELAWTVNRVWHSGEYLVQLDQGRTNSWSWSEGAASASLTISPAANLDAIVGRLDLGAAPFLAAEVKEGLLYVAQGALPVPSTTAAGASQGSLTIYDLASLPRVIKRSTVNITGADPLASANCQLLWPTPETLVLAARGNSWWRGGPIFLSGIETPQPFTRSTETVAPSLAKTSLVADSRIISGFGGSVQQLVAFDVADPAAPVFLNVTKLGKANGSTFSAAFAESGRVFLSRYRSSRFNGIKLPTVSSELIGDDLYRHMLEVVDYSAAGAPVVLPPVNLPGELRGLSRSGQILYTSGPTYNTTGYPDYAGQVVHASAYDGGSAHLIDVIPLRGYSTELQLSGETLYLEQNDYNWRDNSTAEDHSRIEAWTLMDDGKFTLIGQHALPAWSPWTIYSDVLASVENGSVIASDIRTPGQFLELGAFPLNGTPLYELTGGDGDRTSGLWLPLGDYGIKRVVFQP